MLSATTDADDAISEAPALPRGPLRKIRLQSRRSFTAQKAARWLARCSTGATPFLASTAVPKYLEVLVQHGEP